MFSLISCQVNANESPSEDLFHTGMFFMKDVTSVGKEVEKSDPPLCAIGGHIRRCDHFSKNSLALPQKIKCTTSMALKFYS